MASAPNQSQSLPLLYQDLVPLNAEEHKDYRVRPVQVAPFLVKQHCVPLTVDEFGPCHRFLPIVFSAGPNPIPLALMGLNEGTNTLVDAEGKLRRENGYVPAYVRRYPWLLARLDPAREELSLCFDPTADHVGLFEEGERLINDDGSATDSTKEILSFAEQFEQSAMRTNQFMKDLVESGLLMDGELTIESEASATPYIYRGFQMVSEEKLRDLRGDLLRKYNQSGLLMLIQAHLFSLQAMSEIFRAQQDMGMGPPAGAVQTA